MVKFTDEFSLVNPYPNGFTEKNDALANKFIEDRNALLFQAMQNNLYIKFINGDRKGSIAKAILNTESYKAPAAEPSKVLDHYSGRFYIDNCYLYIRAVWDGRSNKPMYTLPHPDIVFLPNYKGPTIWKLFDTKAARAEVLLNPQQYDIEGSLLSVGDKVLYVNARYGQTTKLCKGVIKKFKVIVNSSSKVITTVVERVEDKQLSEISHPSNVIYKNESD